MFATAAAIGSPPQPVRLLVDLAWDTLWVQSSECRDSPCLEHVFTYSSKNSSSYEPGHKRLWVDYLGLVLTGNLTFDTLHVAGIDISKQPFINVLYANPRGFLYFYNTYDGVLGLAPRWNTSTGDLEAASPWMKMVQDGVLDSNMFSIELPHEPLDFQGPIRTGEITFGGINPKYAPCESAFKALPLSNYSDRAWITSAESLTLTFSNGSAPLHEEFGEFTLAGFDVATFYLGLPGHWAETVHKALNVDCGFIWCFVPCELRHRLPNITFGIGGQELTITAFDYAPMIRDPNNSPLCMVTIWSVSRNDYPVNAIVLGTPFMNAFYSVFDLDRREVRGESSNALFSFSMLTSFSFFSFPLFVDDLVGRTDIV